MSQSEWREEHPLVRLVKRRAHDFEFFQLVHLIERIAPDAAPIGEQGPTRREPVRLRPVLNLGFPPGDIANADWVENLTADTGHLRVTTTFMGLYGSDSPLAAHFTETLLPEREDDVRVRDFIDLFHHRVYSLLYRVWKKYRYYVTFRGDGLDPISHIVRGLIGVDTPGLDAVLGMPATKLFRYVGLLSQKPRSTSALIGQLRDYFQDTIPIDVTQCVGRWLAIDQADRNVFGLGKCTLGRDFLLGERIYDRSGKFRVKVGPVGFETYTQFLPTGESAKELAQATRFFCTDPLEFDVQVTLRGDEVPETRLGAEGMIGRLSWTSWLKSQPCPDKVVVFPPVHDEEPEPATL